MRYVSQIFQPLITIPKNAKIKNTEITCKSQKLLLECGLVRPTSSGLFALLPLARRALDKLEALVRQSIESVGGQQVSLPVLTSAQLWEKTGRLDDVGPELMTVEDRHGKKYLLAPTHEEAVADLLADVGPLSYKQLPLLLYQIGVKFRASSRARRGVLRAREFAMLDAYEPLIGAKFRDEARARRGVLRAREFAMLDAYGAHAHAACAGALYGRVADAYKGLFERLGLPVYRVSAPPGDMGGTTSHEWQLCADAGEDVIRVCPSCSHAARDEEGAKCSECGREMERFNSIEVGHTFILGGRYSNPLGAHFVPPAGGPQPLLMSCYGIGITRLLAASIEVLSTEKSIRWPTAIAPYNTIIIGPKEGSKEWQSFGEAGLRAVCDRVSQAAPGDALLDDRGHMTVGKRLMMADRMGYPNIVVCGRAILDEVPKFEVHSCGPRAGPPRLVPLGELGDAVRGQFCEGNDRDVEVNKV